MQFPGGIIDGVHLAMMVIADQHKWEAVILHKAWTCDCSCCEWAKTGRERMKDCACCGAMIPFFQSSDLCERCRKASPEERLRLLNEKQARENALSLSQQATRKE